MGNVIYLECTLCGKRYSEQEVKYTCPSCGIKGILDVEYDYEDIKKRVNKSYFDDNRNYTIWRYIELLPIKNIENVPPLRIGWTPVYKFSSIAKELNIGAFYIKDEGLNPTASFKDRASSVGVMKAMELNEREITCSSTGNAASSLAGISASVGLKSYIFIPQRAPKAKVVQLLIYGATVIQVEGTYKDAFDLSMMASEKWGWYNRNCAINPYLVEGKKTAGLEICEQLSWNLPDFVFISIGDGCTIAGVWKGIKECFKLGLITKLPKMIGVQAEGCQPIKTAWEKNSSVEPVEARTIADSIAVAVPRNPVKAIRAIRESNGMIIAVSDDEILSAMRIQGSKTGIFGEPAAVASFAGLIKASREKILGEHHSAIVINTGNGLKDIDSAHKATGEPIRIPPDISSLEKFIDAT